MRDITAKIHSLRTATAQAVLRALPETVTRIKAGDLPKGDALPVAKVAAIQAAKNTSLLIPYCHPIPVESVTVDFSFMDSTITVQVGVKTIYKTGVEMEALSAAAAAVLTIYDMAKMLDETMTIGDIVLLEKQGGKSDFKQAFASSLRAAVIVMSDSIAEGKKSDRSGQMIVERLQSEGLVVEDYQVIPDDVEAIRRLILKYSDEEQLDLIVTTGGTGVSPRDQTPEAVERLLDQHLPGVAEAIRAYGQERTPYSMLSRSLAGVRKRTLILTLPGSTGGVEDALNAVFPAVLHAYKMLWGGGHGEAASSTQEPSEVSTVQ